MTRSAGLAWLLLTPAALAQTAHTPPPQAPALQANPFPGPVGNPANPPGPAPGEPGFLADLFAPDRTALLGNAFGLRPALARYGVSLGLQEISEVMGNVSGGLRRQAAYDGLTSLSLGLDTAPLGFAGGTANISLLQIHGRNLAAETLYTLQSYSDLSADRTTRLWELWYQQTVLGGRADVKVGQQSLDLEFIGSATAGTFINGAMGWPVTNSAGLYAQGPAYPLSSLGVRGRWRASETLTVLAGVFDDNPPGGPFEDDGQLRGAERSGTAFNLRGGALAIAEVQYALNPQPAADAPGPAPAALPGTYKLGVLFDSGRFPDQRSCGRLQRPGDTIIYAIADQTLWQPDPASPRSFGGFLRVLGAPADRNLVDFSLIAGLVRKGTLPGRDNDSVGVGYGLARVSPAASDADKAVRAGSPTPVRSSESYVEITYVAQLAPWLQLQPDAQYVFTPSGGIANPLHPRTRIGNEAVFGLRTAIVF